MKKLTTATISIIVIVILLLGAGAYYMFGQGVYSKNPSLYNTTEPDGIVKGYLQIMIPRNVEAVDASKKIMVDADISVPEIRLFAARVADAQEFEIGQMRSWYTEWFGVDVPLFIYKRAMAPIEETGDAVAKQYLQDMIAHYEFDAEESRKAQQYITVIQEKNSDSDGQLTITNSHTGIDTTILFAQITEEKRQAAIGEMEELLGRLK